jgi:hypothetical protein
LKIRAAAWYYLAGLLGLPGLSGIAGIAGLFSGGFKGNVFKLNAQVIKLNA